MSDFQKALTVLRSQFSKLKNPGVHDKVYKDECMFSFDSPFSDNGLYVNIVSWYGFGEDYLKYDISKGGKIYLHEKWNQVLIESSIDNNDETNETATKLAIGLPGGFNNGPKYDCIKEHSLVVILDDGTISKFPFPCNDIPEFVSNIIQSIIDHTGMKSMMQVDTWEADQDKKVSKYALDLVQLDNAGLKISQNPSLWKCQESGDTENLWLNLSTGYIGGGRKNWDGSGGSGAALNHYINTGRIYPLCVKLGTITPHGADIYSYASDEDDLVLDPKLSQHLSHWGIDIMKLEKTDKSMSEMEVQLNQKYDWSKLMDGGEEMKLLNGSGFVGLRNIGSSCYLNSIMQVLAHIPEIKERYYNHRNEILTTSPSDPSSDFACQFSKLMDALLTDKYVAPNNTESNSNVTMTQEESKDDNTTLEKYVIAPRMFKQLISKGHSEFSSGRQQDASEYFLHFLNVMSRSERTCLSRIYNNPNSPLTASLFDFHIEERYVCPITNQVKYNSIGNKSVLKSLDLNVPLQCAINKEEVETLQEYKKQKLDTDKTEVADVKLIIPFEACLNSFFAEENVEINNPSINSNVMSVKTTKFKTFPRYLCVKLNRYYVGDNWVQVKIDAQIPMPEYLDLSSHKGTGPQENENIMPTLAENTNATNSITNTPVVVIANEDIVQQLMNMGFSENGCRRAAIATNNIDAEVAMNWIFEHMEDPDFNSPIVESTTATSGSNPSASPPIEMIEMITSMGYNDIQALAALKATDNNLERAIDWIFSHMDDMDEAIALVNNEVPSSDVSNNNDTISCDDGQGKYELLSIVSHIGRSTDHGHYICHIKIDGKWALYNDEKVAVSKNPPLDYGFMYLYRRIDGSGVL